jgi:hypothetical protein
MLTACTIQLNARQDQLDRMLRNSKPTNDETAEVHAVQMVKLPGATVSLSASETLGLGKYGRAEFRDEVTLTYPQDARGVCDLPF